MYFVWRGDLFCNFMLGGIIRVSLPIRVPLPFWVSQLIQVSLFRDSTKFWLFQVTLPIRVSLSFRVPIYPIFWYVTLIFILSLPLKGRGGISGYEEHFLFKKCDIHNGVQTTSNWIIALITLLLIVIPQEDTFYCTKVKLCSMNFGKMNICYGAKDFGWKHKNRR